MGTRARVTTVAGAATLLCAASAFAGGLTALAAPSTVSTPPPVLASAPTPMLVGSCGDTVRGEPGQRVGVRVADLSVVDVGEVPASGSRTYDATPALRKSMGPVAPACKLTAEPLVPSAGPVTKLIAPAVAPVGGALSQVPVVASRLRRHRPRRHRACNHNPGRSPSPERLRRLRRSHHRPLGRSSARRCRATSRSCSALTTAGCRTSTTLTCWRSAVPALGGSGSCPLEC